MFKVKPEAATAMPVSEFSNEISTGTSAPPIGSTTAMPMTKLRPRSTHIRAVEEVARMATTRTMAAMPSSALTICWPG